MAELIKELLAILKGRWPKRLICRMLGYDLRDPGRIQEVEEHRVEDGLPPTKAGQVPDPTWSEIAGRLNSHRYYGVYEPAVAVFLVAALGGVAIKQVPGAPQFAYLVFAVPALLALTGTLARRTELSPLQRFAALYAGLMVAAFGVTTLKEHIRLGGGFADLATGASYGAVGLGAVLIQLCRVGRTGTGLRHKAFIPWSIIGISSLDTLFTTGRPGNLVIAVLAFFLVASVAGA